ncbi:coiled-coil domain-containing protein 89-like [Amphiura filiformis]|uniref:coiled-coil domain-containing protein 89-like n=1 Tax=Amphiura filiformis TaxID=82378 RepID=UPI003B221D73
MSASSSGRRTPKDLKMMVSARKQDIDEMQGNLDKLRNLSHDDKTENAMLRSRIDEQGQLICILKQRADEALTRSQTLERVNKELERFRGEAQEIIDNEIRKFKLLDQRFYELADNHEEMIRIKDDYKFKNVELNKQNAQLKDENARLFSAALVERNEKIASLDKHVGSLKDQCKELSKMNSRLQTEMHDKEAKFQATIEQLQMQLHTSEKQFKDAESQLKKHQTSAETSQANQSVKLEKLSKERDELLQLTMQRGKLIQEKQKEIKGLQDKIKDAEREVKRMDDKFEREAAQVSANLQVIKLKRERDEVSKAFKDLRLEYDAYKKHSTNLLNKEKTLNSHLRNLVA